jgi:hypothetical protein
MNPNFLLPTTMERRMYDSHILAVRRIWRAWFRANTNPEYVICRKRLHQEYHTLKKNTCVVSAMHGN